MTNDSARAIALRDIFGGLRSVVRTTAGPMVATVIALAALNLALDQIPSNALNLVAGFASLAGQYYLTRTAIDRLGLRSASGNERLGGFWLVGLLSGLGILLGMVLLVIPGLYLAARWSLAGPVLIGEQVGANDALGRSWSLTRRSAWAILFTLVIIFIPAAVLGIGFVFAFSVAAPLLGSVLLYLCIFGAFALSWLTYVAIYSLVSDTQDDLAEVFA